MSDPDAGRAALTATLRAALAEGLAELEPGALVQAALPPLPPKHARVVVVAAGKAAAAMARGALARWSGRIDRVLVVTAAGVDASEVAAGAATVAVEVLHAAHPLADARSVAAAERALELAAALGPRDLLLALVSGGASALLAAPLASSSLPDKLRVVRALLDAGAPIREVNTVRRHLSRIKGGRLAAAAHPARVLSLVVSDVIGGEPWDVGSGPTVADPTTAADARAVLQRRTPSLAAVDLAPPCGALRARARIVAGPDDLARAVARALARRGFAARALPGDEGDVDAIAASRVACARRLAPGEALVIPSEPTVTLPAVKGRGGRAGRTALAAARSLPVGVALLCAATDGVDGTSGHAGALVTRDDFIDDAAAVDDALARFDDGPLHERLGTALPGGATGHNLTDVHVLARRPDDGESASQTVV